MALFAAQVLVFSFLDFLDFAFESIDLILSVKSVDFAVFEVLEAHSLVKEIEYFFFYNILN